MLGDAARGRETDIETVVTRGSGVAVDVAEEGSNEDQKTLEETSVARAGLESDTTSSHSCHCPTRQSRVPLLMPVPDA